jgi:uncharacterized membrane protein YqgA involved in biofilm formation
MKTFAVVVGLTIALLSGSVFADDLMNAYQTEYNKMTRRLERAKQTAAKDCDTPPMIFCVGSMAMVGQYKNDLDALKLRVLERYAKLPEWWKE